MWKRSHGRTSEPPPDERRGYRYVRDLPPLRHISLYASRSFPCVSVKPDGHYAADRSSRLRHIRSHRKPFILAENCGKGAENGGFIGQMRVRRIFGIGWWVGGGRLELLRDGGAVVPSPLRPGSTPSTERASSPRPRSSRSRPSPRPERGR